MAKLITVFGATGQQGSEVIKALLEKSGAFKVRGITRNPDGEKAKALKEKGVEIVKASLDDPASLDAAVKGSYGVFLITNYWEFLDQAREETQGKMAADACKKANVKHLVYSGLESIKDITGRACPHYDGKAKVEQHIEEIGIPYTHVRYPFYYENFGTFFQFQKQNDVYVFTTCLKGKMKIASVVDCGVAVAAIFSQPGEYIGKRVGLAVDDLTMNECVEIIAEAIGIKVTVNTISYEDFGKLPFPGADDMAEMFMFFDEKGLDRSIETTKNLSPNTQSFKQWVADNKDRRFIV